MFDLLLVVRVWGHACEQAAPAGVSGCPVCLERRFGVENMPQLPHRLH